MYKYTQKQLPIPTFSEFGDNFQRTETVGTPSSSVSSVKSITEGGLSSWENVGKDSFSEETLLNRNHGTSEPTSRHTDETRFSNDRTIRHGTSSCGDDSLNIIIRVRNDEVKPPNTDNNTENHYRRRNSDYNTKYKSDSYDGVLQDSKYHERPYYRHKEKLSKNHDIISPDHPSSSHIRSHHRKDDVKAKNRKRSYEESSINKISLNSKYKEVECLLLELDNIRDIVQQPSIRKKPSSVYDTHIVDNKIVHESLKKKKSERDKFDVKNIDEYFYGDRTYDFDVDLRRDRYLKGVDERKRAKYSYADKAPKYGGTSQYSGFVDERKRAKYSYADKAPNGGTSQYIGFVDERKRAKYSFSDKAPNAGTSQYSDHDPRNDRKNVSENAIVEELLKDYLKKKQAAEDLEATKSLIANLLPQPKLTTDSDQPDKSRINNTVARIEQTERVGETSYSSAAVQYHTNIAISQHVAGSSSQTKAAQPYFASSFAKTAENYAMKWIKGQDQTNESILEEEDGEEIQREERSYRDHNFRNTDEPRCHRNSPQRTVDVELNLDDATMAQIYLIRQYLNKRKVDANSYKMVGKLPMQMSPNKKAVRYPIKHDDPIVERLAVIPQIQRKDFSSHKQIEGMTSCSVCNEWNMPSRAYQDHVNLDSHLMKTGIWWERYPVSSIPRFSMIWCVICKNYFMLTIHGNTIMGHQSSLDHERSKSRCSIEYDGNVNAPRLHNNWCLLTDLRTTFVNLLPPKKCRYKTPKEALESYKQVYAIMKRKKLILNAS